MNEISEIIAAHTWAEDHCSCNGWTLADVTDDHGFHDPAYNLTASWLDHVRGEVYAVLGERRWDIVGPDGPASLKLPLTYQRRVVLDDDVAVPVDW